MLTVKIEMIMDEHSVTSSDDLFPTVYYSESASSFPLAFFAFGASLAGSSS